MCAPVRLCPLHLGPAVVAWSSQPMHITEGASFAFHWGCRDWVETQDSLYHITPSVIFLAQVLGTKVWPVGFSHWLPIRDLVPIKSMWHLFWGCDWESFVAHCTAYILLVLCISACYTSKDTLTDYDWNIHCVSLYGLLSVTTSPQYFKCCFAV